MGNPFCETPPRKELVEKKIFRKEKDKTMGDRYKTCTHTSDGPMKMTGFVSKY